MWQESRIPPWGKVIDSHAFQLQRWNTVRIHGREKGECVGEAAQQTQILQLRCLYKKKLSSHKP